MRFAVVSIKTSIVKNVIEIEDLDGWPVPKGFEIIQSDEAGPGWVREGDTLKDPNEDKTA